MYIVQCVYPGRWEVQRIYGEAPKGVSPRVVYPTIEEAQQKADELNAN